MSATQQGSISPSPALKIDAAVVVKIMGGAAIPSAATIVFNLLNFLFDNFGKTPLPSVSESTFDIAVGCSFAIVGICITTADRETMLKLVFLLVALIFLVLGEHLVDVFLRWNRIVLTMGVNIIAFIGLSWAIAQAG